MHSEAVMTHDVSPNSEDVALIARFVAGEMEAFETLFRKYQHRFLIVCRRYLNDQTEAEDVVQETFLAIYHGLRHFRRGATFQTWAYRILVRKCSERHRQNARQPLLSVLWGGQRVPASPDDVTRLDGIIMQDALQKLPGEARMGLILKYYEQLSAEEIAQVLNCNVGQAKMRVHRAKNALKDLLEAGEIHDMDRDKGGLK